MPIVVGVRGAPQSLEAVSVQCDRMRFGSTTSTEIRMACMLTTGVLTCMPVEPACGLEVKVTRMRSCAQVSGAI